MSKQEVKPRLIRWILLLQEFNFEIKDKKALITDRDLCIECGACKNNCAYGAIAVENGVGCAAAIIYGWITGKEPQCGCDPKDDGACC